VSFEPDLKTPTSFTVKGGAFEPSTVFTLTWLQLYGTLISINGLKGRRSSLCKNLITTEVFANLKKCIE
jgi:hypothetical protein